MRYAVLGQPIRGASGNVWTKNVIAVAEFQPFKPQIGYGRHLIAAKTHQRFQLRRINRRAAHRFTCLRVVIQRSRAAIQPPLTGRIQRLPRMPHAIPLARSPEFKLIVVRFRRAGINILERNDMINRIQTRNAMIRLIPRMHHHHQHILRILIALQITRRIVKTFRGLLDRPRRIEKTIFIRIPGISRQIRIPRGHPQFPPHEQYTEPPRTPLHLRQHHFPQRALLLPAAEKLPSTEDRMLPRIGPIGYGLVRCSRVLGLKGHRIAQHISPPSDFHHHRTRQLSAMCGF